MPDIPTPARPDPARPDPARPDPINPDLPPAANRALAEAAARRAAGTEANRPVEIGGRDGPDPVRYGDWEKKGIAVDF